MVLIRFVGKPHVFSHYIMRMYKLILFTCVVQFVFYSDIQATTIQD